MGLCLTLWSRAKNINTLARHLRCPCRRRRGRRSRRRRWRPCNPRCRSRRWTRCFPAANWRCPDTKYKQSHQSGACTCLPDTRVVISTRATCARCNRQGARNTCCTGRAGAAHRTSVAGLAVRVLWRRAKTRRERERSSARARSNERSSERERKSQSAGNFICVLSVCTRLTVSVLDSCTFVLTGYQTNDP